MTESTDLDELEFASVYLSAAQEAVAGVSTPGAPRVAHRLARAVDAIDKLIAAEARRDNHEEGTP